LKIPEFVSLLALMGSIVALSIDAMLPALAEIGGDLALHNPNDAQLIVSVMFLGVAVGQVFAGPLSDSFGRKPVIYIGYIIFILGCVLSMLADSFAVMLAGRFLQGLGASAPRIVSVALVRDGYEGSAMARIMSIVAAIFIFVPIIAPAIGQAVLLFLHWRAIFALLLVTALLAFVWFAVRQPETLAPEARRPFALSDIATGTRDVLGRRQVLGYTIALGIMLGAFIGYLSSAQQVFQVVFSTGNWFAFYFGVASLAIGSASVFNARLVVRKGMPYMTSRALVVVTVVSALYFPVVVLCDGVPPLWSFMVWLLLGMFCHGILFGNFNSLAMEPIGHVAGLGAAVVGSLSTLIALPLGWSIGAAFDGTLQPLVAGFAMTGTLGIVVTRWTERTPVAA
jgi:DHA1 family bicyclomycin/chloramphenicol resistance-like MFS transporter